MERTMSLVHVNGAAPSSFEVMPSAIKLAEQIYTTEFVPGHLRGRAPAVLAAILAGHEIGVGPMESLRHIAVIDGRPSFDAHLQRAQVMRHGHELWVEEATNTSVTVAGRRRDSAREGRVRWSMDDARKAGLANKQNWQRYPRQMLVARATTELVNQLFPDVLGSIGFVGEDEVEGEDTAPTPAPARQRTAKRSAASMPAPPAPIETSAEDLNPLASIPDPLDPLPSESPPEAPQASEAAPSEPDATDTPDRYSDAQRAAIMAMAGECGFERGERLLVGGLLIGRPLDTMNSLTRAEASAVIDGFRDLRDGVRELSLDPDTGVAVGWRWSEREF
jgi:hypothetical protein